MSSPNFESAEFESDAFESEVLEPASEQIGQTSQEAGSAVAAATGDGTEKPSKAKINFTIFDVMLLISLVCVTLATLRLFMALGEYGNIFSSYPWRTSEF